MANRYWVGGTGTWNGANTANWASTSNGPSGASVPTSVDDVFFDAFSGTGTATVNGSRVAKSINCTGYTGTLDISSTANLTLSGSATFSSGMTFATTGTNPAIIFNATATLTSAGKTLCGITVNGAGITVTLADALTVSSICVTTLTAGTLDLAGFNLSTGNFSSNNTNTRSIAFGTGQIQITTTTAGGTSISMSNMLGFSSTFSGGPFGPVGGFYRDQVSETTFNIGTTNQPSNANAFNLTVTGSATLTFASQSKVRTLSFSQDFVNATCTVIGGCKFSTSCGLSPSATYTSFSLAASGTGTFFPNGKTISSFTVDDELLAGTNIIQLLGTLNVVNSVSLGVGTFQTNGHAINAVSFQSTNSNNRTLNMGGSVITLSGSGSTVWNCATSTNLTVTGTGSIVLNSASAKTFAGGGKTYPTLRNAGAGALTISGNNTFTTIENTVQPTTFTFTSGTTQTVTNFNVNGSDGNLITINSTTPGSQATLSKASGQVLANFLSLQDNNATGGAQWFLKSGLRGSNVSGWYVNQALMAWFF